MTRRERLRDARLYLLATTALCRRPLADTIRLALRGGVDVVQLREKELPDGEFADLAARIGPVVREAGALFLLNDRVRIAAEVPCDGAHVGQDDLAPGEARERLGPDLLLGVSTHDREQALSAERDGADYVGIGPVFATGTKETGYEPRGPGTAGEVDEILGIPAFAIGGVDASGARALAAAGARRVAVSSAICGAEDPEAAAREIRTAITSKKPGGSSRRT
jgi:thiamine-phosphate pyrophosphorylase